MLCDFFRINLPYGIAKNKDGFWMAFNREYMPLGYNDTLFKKGPGTSYNDLPVYTSYKKVTEQFLLDLADDESHIHRDDDGKIVKLFLYSDSTNPMNQPKESFKIWDSYFDKLKKLAKLEAKDMR